MCCFLKHASLASDLQKQHPYSSAGRGPDMVNHCEGVRLAFSCTVLVAIGLPLIAVKSTPDAGDEPLRVDVAKFSTVVPATSWQGPLDIFLTLYH